MAELKYNFVSAFVGEDRKEILAGVEQIRTEYRVTFNPYTSPCFGGKFESLEDAEKQIERLRLAARKINTMCLNCNSDCAGSFDRQQARNYNHALG